MAIDTLIPRAWIARGFTIIEDLVYIGLGLLLAASVQVSIREHSIVPEPFLLVGVIAAIRRVLVITAEFGHIPQLLEPMLQRFIAELAVLTLLILILVISLLLLRKQGGAAIAAERVV
jgi:hypothetical protein